ncbi:DNA-binding proteins Bright/BRCAA1/RBP1 and proteins containing BRIGHT domain [Mactra antiquata]
MSEAGTHLYNSKDKVPLVKFADVKMATSGHRGSWNFFSRRNKCLVFSLILAAVIILLMLNSDVLKSAPKYTGELCKLDDIELQKNFDKKKFAGNWYGAYTKGLDSGLLASVLQFYDVKINFIPQDDGNYLVKSVGSKFYGMWCPDGLGHMESPDKNHPQKMEVFFDTPTGKKFGRKSTWLLKTDYTSYGVLYSCWEETDDGYCTASGAYVGVIQRKKEPLSQDKMEEINGVIAKSCINPKALRPVKHDGYCKDVQKAISS